MAEISKPQPIIVLPDMRIAALARRSQGWQLEVTVCGAGLVDCEPLIAAFESGVEVEVAITIRPKGWKNG